MLKYPWNDYSGQLSPLKLDAFVHLFMPTVSVAFAFATHTLGPRELSAEKVDTIPMSSMDARDARQIALSQIAEADTDLRSDSTPFAPVDSSQGGSS